MGVPLYTGFIPRMYVRALGTKEMAKLSGHRGCKCIRACVCMEVYRTVLIESDCAHGRFLRMMMMMTMSGDDNMGDGGCFLFLVGLREICVALMRVW